jgi:hypothetical protein
MLLAYLGSVPVTTGLSALIHLIVKKECDWDYIEIVNKMMEDAESGDVTSLNYSKKSSIVAPDGMTTPPPKTIT